MGEPEPQVPRLAVPAPVGAAAVPEPELQGQFLHLAAARVVQHERDGLPRIRLGQHPHMSPGVAEHRQWLAADRQEHIDRRVTRRLQPPVPVEIKVAGEQVKPERK
jgi:hypothetical protein